MSTGQVDLTQADESFDIPKPLVVALRELGPVTGQVVKILLEAGADHGLEDYTGLSQCYSVYRLIDLLIYFLTQLFIHVVCRLLAVACR